MSSPSSTYVQSFVNSLSPSYLVLDTETSGLRGEIIELTIISYSTQSSQPTILFNSKFKPSRPIEPGSIKVHHITDEDCKDSPTYLESRAKILYLLQNKTVVTYNALFDRRAFHYSDRAWGLSRFGWKTWCRWKCAMYAIADLMCLDQLRWYKLIVIAQKLGLQTDDITLHSACGDTLLAGRVVRFMIDFFHGGVSVPPARVPSSPSSRSGSSPGLLTTPSEKDQPFSSE